MIHNILQISDIDALKKIFSVDENGNLIALCDRRGSNKKAGSIIGRSGTNGRLIVRFEGRSVFVHQVVWALTTGQWPDKEVDHINGDYLDNRPSNLRLSIGCGNSQNRKLNVNSTSGYKGVYFAAKYKCWRVQVIAERKIHAIFGFESKETAGEFASLLRSIVHGEFARDQ